MGSAVRLVVTTFVFPIVFGVHRRMEETFDLDAFFVSRDLEVDDKGKLGKFHRSHLVISNRKKWMPPGQGEATVKLGIEAFPKPCLLPFLPSDGFLDVL